MGYFDLRFGTEPGPLPISEPGPAMISYGIKVRGTFVAYEPDSLLKLFCLLSIYY